MRENNHNSLGLMRNCLERDVPISTYFIYLLTCFVWFHSFRLDLCWGVDGKSISNGAIIVTDKMSSV